jgi:hypothetical protein
VPACENNASSLLSQHLSWYIAANTRGLSTLTHVFVAALIDRQRKVHEAIKEEMQQIHALTLKCKTPEQAEA